MKYRSILLSFIAVVSFLFYACGDSSSSTSNGVSALSPSSVNANAAASNIPKLGSVIQGSKDANNDEVTDDVVALSLTTGGISVTINGGATLSSCTNAVVSAASPRLCTSEDQTAQAAVFSAFSDASNIPEFNQDDPVAFGFYSYTDSANNNEVVWGMFADGLTESETATVTAPNAEICYSGNIIVFHALDDNASNPDFQTESGNVALTRGTDGSITGEITGLTDSPTVDVVLQSAADGDSDNLFTGDVSIEGIPADAAGRTITAVGKWGVQFFGTGMEYLVGTWGAAFEDPVTSTSGSAVGVLFAEPLEECPTPSG